MKIVLLPGLDGTGRLFEAFVSCLPEELQSIVCVYPKDASMGYGELLQFALDCCPEDEPYLLLGESFSGPIAIEIAARNPALLRGVILVNTFVACPRPHVVKLIRLIPDQVLTSPPKVLLRFILRQREESIEPFISVQNVLQSLPANLIRSRLAAVEAVDVRRMATNIDVPVCLLQAADDILVPESARRLVLDFLSVPELHGMRGNHFSLQTHPKAAARIVSEFHERVGSIARK